ncbi:MAG: hypothetical protein G01um101429_550 [Parcubacteria group bacterium Gr01-1014_29]|nr:MAG: hypothetical protein G01um101429_550 [Parcubacteria group bacterium Gr01-1014_29]
MNEKEPNTPSSEPSITAESTSDTEQDIHAAIDAALETAVTPQSLDSLLKNMEKIKTIPLEEAQRFMSRFETNIVPQLREDKSLHEGMRHRERLERFVSEVDRRRKIVNEERARIKAQEEKLQQARLDAHTAYKKPDDAHIPATFVAPGRGVQSVPKEKRGFFSKISEFFRGT